MLPLQSAFHISVVTTSTTGSFDRQNESELKDLEKSLTE